VGGGGSYLHKRIEEGVNPDNEEEKGRRRKGGLAGSTVGNGGKWRRLELLPVDQKQRKKEGDDFV
jgi:hypothetical protein